MLAYRLSQLTTIRAIKAHLDSFLPCLERRQDKGRTPYNLRNCAYHGHFSGEKLLWRDMAETGCFAYSDTAIFTNDKAFMMTGPNLRFLCAVLNSSAVTWLVSKSGLTTGMGLTQWKKFVVESIPVVQPSKGVLAEIDHAVRALLAASDADDGEEVHDLDCAIDRMVLELYGLTLREAEVMTGQID